MSKVDLRKLKDQATKAIEKKQYAKAADFYLQIADAEPNDPDWRQRAGEALRKVPDGPRAAAQMTLAADGYARGGFLLKAIAVCKVVLQIEPKHTATQLMLSELYATREGRSPPGKVALTANVDLARTPSGEFQLVPRAAAPGVSPPRTPMVPNAARSSSATAPLQPFAPRAQAQASSSEPMGSPPSLPPLKSRAPDEAIAIDQSPRRPEPPRALPEDVSEPALALAADSGSLVGIDDRAPPKLFAPTTPLEMLPLHAVLGGKKSAQFDLNILMPLAEQPSAYEITLDEELSLADAIPPDPAPSASASSSSSTAAETDFSDLMDDAPPVKIAPPPPARLQLPKSPLLSSLGPDELRHVIERVEVREFAAGDVIMRQGESGGSLFVIVHGGVDVQLEGETTRTLATLGEGAFFGELGLLTNFPRSATVRARDATQLLEISRELVLDMVAGSPDVLKTLLRFFRDRLLDRLLGQSPLFASLPPDEARSLAARFMFLELEPRVRAVVEGERSPGLFLLLCGEVDVIRAGAPLAALGPGDVFGEISLLDRQPASASIVTRTKCWALELPREGFQEIMVTYPALLEYVGGLAERRKETLGREERVEFL